MLSLLVNSSGSDWSTGTTSRSHASLRDNTSNSECTWRNETGEQGLSLHQGNCHLVRRQLTCSRRKLNWHKLDYKTPGNTSFLPFYPLFSPIQKLVTRLKKRKEKLNDTNSTCMLWHIRAGSRAVYPPTPQTPTLLPLPPPPPYILSIRGWTLFRPFLHEYIWINYWYVELQVRYDNAFYSFFFYRNCKMVKFSWARDHLRQTNQRKLDGKDNSCKRNSRM